VSAQRDREAQRGRAVENAVRRAAELCGPLEGQDEAVRALVPETRGHDASPLALDVVQQAVGPGRQHQRPEAVGQERPRVRRTRAVALVEASSGGWVREDAPEASTGAHAPACDGAPHDLDLLPAGGVRVEIGARGGNAGSELEVEPDSPI